jgi:hypothetical protein
MDLAKGSITLHFSSGAYVMLQCPFECEKGKSVLAGHGEDVNSASLLFQYLNERVNDAIMDRDYMLTFIFEDGRKLRIIPERNGLESYVITTQHGICPILVS